MSQTKQIIDDDSVIEIDDEQDDERERAGAGLQSLVQASNWHSTQDDSSERREAAQNQKIKTTTTKHQ